MNEPFYLSANNAVVHIDDAVLFARQLRSIGQKLFRRRKGLWVAYTIEGMLPVSHCEIIIDAKRIMNRGDAILFKNKYVPFQLPPLKPLDNSDYPVKWETYYGRFLSGQVSSFIYPPPD